MIGGERTDPACLVCQGKIECKGGGNMRCRKRDPRASRIAGILDTYGGLRFVVTHKKNLKSHARPDELLFIAPGLVHEPIAWNDIPHVVAKIEWWVDKQLRERPPNTEHGVQAATMYRLRCLENKKKSLDLSTIVET